MHAVIVYHHSGVVNYMHDIKMLMRHFSASPHRQNILVCVIPSNYMKLSYFTLYIIQL